MKTKLGILVVVLLLAALPILGACATQKPPEETKTEVVIGLLDDQSGPLAGTVSPRVQGFKDCVASLNEEKAGIEGHPIKTIIVDHKMDPTLATSGWERMKNEKVPVVISWMSTGVPSLLAAADKDRIPILSGAGTMDQDFPANPASSFFYAGGPQWAGTVYSVNNLIEKDWAKTGEKRTPIVGYDLVSIGSNPKIMAKAIKMDMEKRGWEYVITHTSIATVDCTTQVLQVKNAKCDYLYLMSTTASTTAYVKELERQSFHPKLYGAAAMGSREIWDSIGKPLTGAVAIQYFVHYTDTDIPLVQKIHELDAKLHPEIKTRPGDYVRGFTDTLVIAEALARGIKNVGIANLNGNAMKAAMESMNNYEPMGLGIGYTWTAADRQGVPGCRWYQWKDDGTLNPVTKWEVFAPLPPEQRNDAWWIN